MTSHIIRGFKYDDFVDFNAVMDKEGKKIIYIDSNGGPVLYQRAMTDRLERDKDDVELVGMWLGSSAFTLFSAFSGKKGLVEGCDAVVHHVNGEYPMFVNSKGKHVVSAEDEATKYRFKDSILYNSPPDFLTAKEVKKFMSGGDIYISYERLCSIFNC